MKYVLLITICSNDTDEVSFLGFDCKDGAQSALSQLVIDDDDKPRPLPTIAGISCDMVAPVVCWCVWGLMSITCPK